MTTDYQKLIDEYKQNRQEMIELAELGRLALRALDAFRDDCISNGRFLEAFETSEKIGELETELKKTEQLITIGDMGVKMADALDKFEGKG